MLFPRLDCVRGAGCLMTDPTIVLGGPRHPTSRCQVVLLVPIVICHWIPPCWFPPGRSGGETASRPGRPSGIWPIAPPRASSSPRTVTRSTSRLWKAPWAQRLTTRGLVKLYEGDSGQRQPETRYSPAQCLGTRRVCIAGDPGPHHVSTSFAERQNLSMRMRTRGFTRLTSLTLRHYPIASHCPNVLLEQLPVFDRLYEDCSGGVRWVHDGRGTARSLRSTAGALRPAPPRRNRPR